ncbi:MAG: hypothetical protein V3S33_05185 [Gammaproteobacteria bacterium]
MTKKIIVLVRNRQAEALRMALGMTLADDAVDVCVVEGKLEETEANTLNLGLLKEMDVDVLTCRRENEGLEFVAPDDLPARLTQYDHILPY